MKIGLLLCDHVHPDYVEQFGDYPDMFAELFPEAEFQVYDATQKDFPQSIDECDAYIGTGSKYSVYEDIPWIHELSDFLRKLHKARKCFVGVCFSHQLIGHALGGKVEKADVGWCVGVHKFEPLGFNLLMMCQDQIIALPPGAVKLAGTEKCPNGIIRIDDHILGIQAHPEFSKEYDRLLIEMRGHKIGAKTAEEGVESLNEPVSREQIKNYILHFISNAI